MLHSIVLIVVLMAAGAAPSVAGPAPGSAGSDLANVRLAPMEGFEDDDAYARAIASRASEFALQVSKTTDPRVRADILLSAANMILARELEPACTARLLGFADAQVPLSKDRVRDTFDRADAFLIKADAALEEAGELPSPPEEWLSEAKGRLATLGAFAHGLRVFLLPEHGDDEIEVNRRAASGLSILLEDSRPRVAAAANLLQACLRAREPDPSRAKSVLDLALSEPARNAMPYAFFGRILRCRVLASHGGYAVALALLTQIEDLADLWLDSTEERADARRAITFVEIQILKDWGDSMSGQPDSAERAWCLDRIKTLVAERFGDDRRTVFRLSTAIPIVANPEDAGRHHDDDKTTGD